MLLGQRLEHIDAAARQKRRDDLERRILRSRADQANVALFDVRQERILLGLVEAVNLVDENDGARSILSRPLRIGHDLLDFLDAGQHRGELDELRLGHACDDLRQRSLTRPRRTPEDERADIVALQLGTQRLPGRDQVLLANKLIQRPRPHTISQWPSAIAGVVAARNGLEKTHQPISPQSHRDTEKIGDYGARL